MAKAVKTFDVPNGSSRLVKNAVTVAADNVTIVDTTSSQTMTNKTLTSPTITTPTISGAVSTMTVATLAGAGTTITDAAAIVSSAPALILATGGNNSVGIKMPVAITGASYRIKNDQAANGIMKVYPQVNSTINGLSANSALSMAANTCMEIIAFNTTAWFTIPLLPS